MCENPIVMVHVCKQINMKAHLHSYQNLKVLSQDNWKAQEFNCAILDEVLRAPPIY